MRAALASKSTLGLRRRLVAERLERRRMLSIQMVADINQLEFPPTSYQPPIGAVEFQGDLFFPRYDPGQGTELWRYDADTSEASLFLDINPGSSSSSPSGLTNLNGVLYFGACDGVHGHELWRSDGTAVGTQMVADALPGDLGASPGQIVPVDSGLMFTGTNGLWRSDGTSAGTAFVAQVDAGQEGLVPVGERVFFTSWYADTGEELWTSDGTTSGTVMVTDLTPGSYWDMGSWEPFTSSPKSLTAFNGQLYFLGSYHLSGLWRSDGTEAGTVLIDGDAEFGYVYSGYRQLEVLNDLLYYPGYDGPAGLELWRSDGAPGNETLVADLVSGSGSSSPQQFLAAGDSLYFTATDPVHGRELWKSDGTAGGTALVKSINPNTSSYLSPVDEMANIAGQLYFAGDDGTHGLELWKSDGTPEGTQLVADLWPGSSSFPTGLTAVGSTVLFTADGPSLPRGLYRSDGSEVGTTRVIDASRGTQDSSPQDLAVFDGQVIFDANDGIHGREVWISDGTGAGTRLLKDIAPGAADSRSASGEPFVAVGTKFFFVTQGNQLWMSDGAESATTLLRTFGGVRSMVAFQGQLIFNAYDSNVGWELWKSDGTTTGTTLLKDIWLGVPGGVYFLGSAELNGYLYFAANDGDHGSELWRTDGTTAGTELAVELMPGSSGAYPANMTNAVGTLYFTASDGAVGHELWMSDGTVSGTVLVKNIAPDRTGPYGEYIYSSHPANFFHWNGQVYFSAYHPDSGSELWKTDGTESGTVLVKDIEPGFDYNYGYLEPRSSFPTTFFNLGGKLLFAVADGELFDPSRALWTTDGTESGTSNVSSSGPGSIPVIVGNSAYFAGDYSYTGASLWRTDGTTTGTVVADPDTRVDGTIVALDNTLYYPSKVPFFGSELHKFALGAPIPDPGGPYSVETGSSVVFDASATTDPDHPFASLTFEWDLDFDGQFGESGAAATRGDELGVMPTFSAAALYSGSYSVPLRVTDPAGLSSTTSAMIAVTPPVNNLPPLADAGGPYSVVAGGSVIVDASSTTDPNLPGDAFLFDWDFDGDGMFGETGAGASQGNERGATATFSATGLIAQTWVVNLRVTDAGGLVSTDASTIDIVPPANNQPPTAEAGGPYAILPNGNVSLVGLATDPNLPTDALVFAWDLDGDGLFGESGLAATRGDERGSNPMFMGSDLATGSTTVSLRVSDSGGLTAFDTAQISVIPPVVLGASASSGLPVSPGAILTESLEGLVVSFSREMNVVGGAAGVHSVTNVANWRLRRDGTDLTARISSIDYDATSFQATLQLAVPLTLGDINLEALPTIHDGFGNPLDGDGDGLAGGSYSLDFAIALPTGGPEFRANTYTADDQDQASVAIEADGDFLVAWTSNLQDLSGDGVYAQRYAADGSPRGAEFRVNSSVSGAQFQPSAAVDDDGEFVVVWEGFGGSETAGIHARRFDSNGTALGTTFIVNSTTSGTQTDAAIAMDADGDFVVVWSGNGAGDAAGVFARRYDRFGAAQGSEFLVNVTTTGAQQQPVVAMDDAGNFTIAWAGVGTGDSDGVFYRVYDLSGVALTAELRANVSTAFATSRPAISMDALGNFVLAWQSTNQDGSGDGIQARRFTASGTALGGSIAVNTTTAGSQSRPAVAREPDGDFLVTWQSADGSGDGIYGQRFLADGTPDGAEFLINTTTGGNQSAPALATVDGAAIVVWESAGQDGSGLGVYGQRLVHTLGAPPRVVGVTVGSTLSTHVDYPVPVGSGEQLRTVPVALANQFQITFDSHVYVLASDLQPEGQQAPNYAIVDFSYDAPSRTATWTLAQPIGADRIALRLSDAVTTLTGEVLDGEWDNPMSLTDPSGSISGDGTYGGEFEFHLTSLPGDANRDNQVTGADYTIWADGFDGGTGAADAVFAEGDFNGDGHVTGADYTLWADNFGLDFRAPPGSGRTSLAFGSLGIAAKPLLDSSTGSPELGADPNEPVAPAWGSALDRAYSDVPANDPSRACPWSESEGHRRHAVRSRAALVEAWAAELATWRLNASSMTKLVPGARAPVNSEA